MDSNKVAIVIPALDPEKGFVDYCNNLIGKGIDRLIIIDDGSNSKEYFNFPLSDLASGKIVLLKHYINLGKGRSLKNAINYYLNMPDVVCFCGIITVDSDGQHSIEDVFKMKEALLNDPDRLILGSRDFDKDNVPYKSNFGNRITRVLFYLLHGVRLKDTQTGLRAIPTQIIPLYMDLSGERFEYEMNMLIFSARNNIRISEIPIHTIYKENNAGTHFRPIHDSVAIYKLLLGTFFCYVLSSLSSFVLDISIFKLMVLFLEKAGNSLTDRIFLATIIARIFSSIYNFLMNRKVVFHSSKKQLPSLFEYYLLCLIQMLVSASAVAFIVNNTSLPETIIKMIVDSFLFIGSFYVQKNFIFRGNS